MKGRGSKMEENTRELLEAFYVNIDKAIGIDCVIKRKVFQVIIDTLGEKTKIMETQLMKLRVTEGRQKSIEA